MLIVDDEPMIVRALERMFERRGHVVRSAHDARGGLELARRFRFDAALVDGRMPGSGYTVLAALERDPEFTGPLILMTGAVAADPEGNVGPEVIRLQKPFRLAYVVDLVEDRVGR